MHCLFTSLVYVDQKSAVNLKTLTAPMSLYRGAPVATYSVLTSLKVPVVTEYPEIPKSKCSLTMNHCDQHLLTIGVLTHI